MSRELNFSFSLPLIYVGPHREGLHYGMTGSWEWLLDDMVQFRPHGSRYLPDGSRESYVVPLSYLYSHQLTPTRYCPKPEKITLQQLEQSFHDLI